jgi:hypothetical protein
MLLLLGEFGVNTKALRNVNSTVEDLMKVYIFPGFSIDIEDYPTTICSNCHRNLFLLKSGKSSRNAFKVCFGLFHVKVGTPDNKAARRTVNQIIKHLQIVLELSLNRTKQMMAALRKGMGTATAIESNIFGKLQQIEDTISGFYQVQKVYNC